jgi:glycosyltransferase involved in cell wall biosynthesis
MSGLHILYSFPSRLGTTGIGTTAWYQVAGLLREGVHVELYCGSLEKHIEHLNKSKETLVPFGIKIPMRMLGRNGAFILHDKIVAKALRHTYRKSHIDIVHCWPSGSLETLKTARELGIKTVLERPCCHTRVVFDAVETQCRRLGMKLERSHFTAFDKKRLAREEQEFSLADKLLCPSEWCAESFIGQGTSRKQIAVHQYGYDPAFFHLPSDDQRENDPVFKIAFVGRCEPGKGLHYALDAWLASEASKNGIFYICGNYVKGYREILADKLVHPSIKELGFQIDINSILQKCHAMVLPSISEGSALVTYEARACGCVLLVSEASGAHCQDMRDALVHKVDDVVALRQHIDALAGNRELLHKIRERSIAGIKDLTWKKAGEVLLSTYMDCINETVKNK